MNLTRFDAFFRKATGSAPFPFQERFAEGLPPLVSVPTGLGKTAMVVVGWLWRRFGGDEGRQAATPRRLVYCLPMRVLVEQTRNNARDWIDKLGLRDSVSVTILMGGEAKDDWDIHPEREAILVGTQEMLLSRALNRGYAASRARWPMQFGLLHTDCLWVFDEIQLMGSGLATTAQLEAFRRLLGPKDGQGCQSIWMSATLDKAWLETVDFKPSVDKMSPLELGDEDRANDEIRRRREAKKPLQKATATMGDVDSLADKIHATHKPGTRTIVIVNTVKRACALYEALEGQRKKGNPTDIVLLHARFRPEDRGKRVKEALAEIEPDAPGTIIVSTQVVEAGVDMDATRLFTEIAPWASLVQRFGRYNRFGKKNDVARVFWIDLPATEKGAEKFAPPYDIKDLQTSAQRLASLEDIGIESLPTVALRFEQTHVIRKKDLVDLFDTTPDLAGNDVDIDRFVREIEESDVRLFWRAWEQPKGNEPPSDDTPAPRREELCPAPIGEFKKFVEDEKRFGKVWRWNFLDKKWEKSDPKKTAPGQVFLVHADAGGYSPERGWSPDGNDPVDPIEPPKGTKANTPEANEDDLLSRIGGWQTIAEHSDDICRTLEPLLASLAMPPDEAEALRHAARWHDRGKAHEIFQDAIHDGQTVEHGGKTTRRRERPSGWQNCRFIAKAPGRQKKKDGEIVDAGFWRWPPYRRPHFRHELASAVSVLHPENGNIPDGIRNLVAYLVAAHHGKVRLSIRSLPDEIHPKDRRFARGVWEGDLLPETDLGGGVTAPAVTLSLEPMEIGLCGQAPFTGQPSWLERMLNLRDLLGPFRLAYLEAILRAADARASQEAEERQP